MGTGCTVAKAVKRMQQLRFSAVDVENAHSRLVGILTERDVVTKVVADCELLLVDGLAA